MLARIALIALTMIPAVTPARAADTRSECKRQLEDARSKRIACNIDWALDPAGRAQLSGWTSGALTDASCQLRVSLDREKVMADIDRLTIVSLPTQSGLCTIVSNGGPLPMTFDLTPQLRLANKRVISATPNLQIRSGLPIFAGSLQDLVNTDPNIQKAMIDAVNDFLAHARSR